MADRMRFSEDAEQFMRPGCDRLVGLGRVLSGLGLRYSVASLGKAKHVLMQVGRGLPRLALVAHYDRSPEGFGTLDNSCACLQLAAFAARLSAKRGAGGPATGDGAGGGGLPGFSPSPPILIAFTDAEEAPGSGEASSQGSFALARALMAKGALVQTGSRGAAPQPLVGRAAAWELAALVFDVTGRGGRLVYSTAPVNLLERNGLEGSPVAAGYRSLVGLAARAAAGAGVPAPLGAELPWSDDLGLTLGGMPALTLSLLPEAEIPILETGRKPPTWMLLHTAQDSPDKAEAQAFDVMAAFLSSLDRNLAETGLL